MKKESTILAKFKIIFDKPENYDDVQGEIAFSLGTKRESGNNGTSIVVILCFQLFLLYIIESKSLPAELSFLIFPVVIIYFYLFRRLSLLYIKR